MLGSAVLDTAIGLIFIFFVVSTLCSSTFSLLARLRSMRGRLLQEGLLYLLGTDLRNQLMDHPLVQDVSLTGTSAYDRLVRAISGCTVQDRKNTDSKLVASPCPAYIPPETFTRAFLDMITSAAQEGTTRRVFTRLQKAGVEHLGEAAQARIYREVDRLLDLGEEAALPFVEDLLDRIEERQVIDPEVKARLLDDIRGTCSDRANVMILIQMGIEELDLPERTIEFLQRHIELLQRRRRHESDITIMANFDAFQDNVSSWFTNSMDSLTGIFKARTQMYLFVIATLVTLFFNLNALTVANTLWTSPTVRDSVVQAAEATAADPDAVNIAESETPIEIFQQELASLNLPVGWTQQELDAVGLGFLGSQVDDSDRAVPDTFTNLIGWLAMIFAALFGAPFWYDVLNKIVNLRTDVKPD